MDGFHQTFSKVFIWVFMDPKLQPKFLHLWTLQFKYLPSKFHILITFTKLASVLPDGRSPKWPPVGFHLWSLNFNIYRPISLDYFHQSLNMDFVQWKTGRRFSAIKMNLCIPAALATIHSNAVVLSLFFVALFVWVSIVFSF